MSHTRRLVVDVGADGREHSVTFIFNMDLSGPVEIRTQSKTGDQKSVYVPGWVLVEFLAERVAARWIAKLQNEPKTALGVPADWPSGWGNRGVR